VLSTEVSGGGTERAWRPPLTLRVARAVCLGICTALRSGNTGLPFAVREAAAVLYAAGAALLGLTFPIIRDHRRKRLRGPR
jgi:hypothetical protein